MEDRRTATGDRHHVFISLDTVRNALEGWKADAKRSIQELGLCKKSVINMAGSLNYPDRVIATIEEYISLLNDFARDLSTVVNGIKKGLSPRVIDKLEEIRKRFKAEDDRRVGKYQELFDAYIGDKSGRPLWDQINLIIADMLSIQHNFEGQIDFLKMSLRSPAYMVHEDIEEQRATNHRGLTLCVPPGTTWDDITIEFVGLDEVRIQAGDKNFGTKTYIALGFDDKRTTSHSPDAIWQTTLIPLAKANGFLKFADVLDHDERVSLRKNLSTLRKRLRAIFGMEKDPFLPFPGRSAYKSKFKVSVLNRDQLSERQESEGESEFEADVAQKTTRCQRAVTKVHASEAKNRSAEHDD